MTTTTTTTTTSSCPLGQRCKGVPDSLGVAPEVEEDIGVGVVESGAARAVVVHADSDTARVGGAVHRFDLWEGVGEGRGGAREARKEEDEQQQEEEEEQQQQQLQRRTCVLSLITVTAPLVRSDGAGREAAEPSPSAKKF